MSSMIGSSQLALGTTVTFEEPGITRPDRDLQFDPSATELSPLSLDSPAIAQDSSVCEIRVLLAGSGSFEGGDVRALLDAEPDARVVAERAEDVSSALNKYEPDLLVLDVRAHSEISPLIRHRLAHKHSAKDLPLVLFIAPDASYAAAAFECQALDFLTSPLDTTRFRQAMDRVRREFARIQYSRIGRQLLSLSPGSQRSPEQLAFRVNGRYVFIPVNDIDWIEASANYIRINAGPDSHLVRESIGKISHRLDRKRFVRIHRSVIVNALRIKELHSCNAGEYIATLKNGKKLPCSRGFRSELERFISSCL